MTLNIEVDGKLEAALRAQANEQGVSPDKVARRVLAQALAPEERDGGVPAPAWTASEEKARAFVQWAQAHRDTPPLSDGAVSRAGLNPDRW